MSYKGHGKKSGTANVLNDLPLVKRRPDKCSEVCEAPPYHPVGAMQLGNTAQLYCPYCWGNAAGKYYPAALPKRDDMRGLRILRTRSSLNSGTTTVVAYRFNTFAIPLYLP